jgi:predicted glycoside hydrolase/deacetylase ChbG (UPF0249 family)
MGRLHPRLEVYADDYGLSTGVSAAILQVAERLDAVSVIRPLWPERLRVLPLRLGMHWAPFTRLAPLLWQKWTRRLDAAALSAEFDRQLEDWTAGVGRRPDYVDSHMHVHQVPGVREVFLERLAHHGLNCERSTFRFRSLQRAGPLQRRVLRGYGRGFSVAKPPLLMTLNYKSLDPLAMAEWVARELARSPEALQLIVHPGLAADPELKARDGLWRHRDKDVQLLEALGRRL